MTRLTVTEHLDSEEKVFREKNHLNSNKTAKNGTAYQILEFTILASTNTGQHLKHFITT